MKTVKIVYGSTTGATAAAAIQLAGLLDAPAVSVAQAVPEDFQADLLILGSSTWGYGELQDDWYDGLDKLKEANLSGKTIALFGCGDCESYSDTFCGAMGDIYEGLKDSGAKFIGAVSTDGYTYDDSAAVVDGKFVGLALDDVNEDDKTDERIDAWLNEIKPNL